MNAEANVAVDVPEELIKLDLGCGKNKVSGFTGVDSIKFDNVDEVVDLTKPWPWKDDSISEVYSSHFIEHLTMEERVHFFNELYRVLKFGSGARIITPHWSHACAYGDPSHKSPPVSEWFYLYLNKAWRDGNSPHVDSRYASGPLVLNCDFDFVTAGSWDQWLETRSQPTKEFAMARYINSYRDLIMTVTKTKR